MNKKLRRVIALLLCSMLCIGQVGCDFVISEKQVLTNPQNSGTDSEGETPDNQVAEGEETTDATQEGEGEGTDTKTDDKSDGNKNSGGSNTSTAKGNKEPKLSGKLEVQIWTNETVEVSNAWTAVIDEFEEQTGVKVTAVIGSQANTRMTKRWLGDNPPDIALLAGSGIPDVALEEAGGLYDLSDVIKKGYVYGTNEKIWDVIDQNYYQKSGEDIPFYRTKIYAQAEGIFWDQAYFKELGITAPTNYTELQQFVKDSKETGVAAFTTYGMAGHYALNSMVLPAIAAYGQNLYEKCDKGLKSGWGSKEVRDVFQRWYDFCRMDNALMKGTSSYDHTTAQMKWLNHEALLIGNGGWLPYEMKKNTPSDFEMTFATSPLTLKSQKPAVVLGAGGMIVAKKAKNLDNAKAFVRFLYTKEAQEILATAQGYLPVRKDMDINDMNMMASQKRALNYVKSGKAKIIYDRYNWGSLNEELNAAVHGLMTGKMNVDEAVNHITKKAK